MTLFFADAAGLRDAVKYGLQGDVSFVMIQKTEIPDPFKIHDRLSKIADKISFMDMPIDLKIKILCK